MPHMAKQLHFTDFFFVSHAFHVTSNQPAVRRNHNIIRTLQQNNFSTGILFQTSVARIYIFCLRYTVQQLHLLPF